MFLSEGAPVNGRGKKLEFIVRIPAVSRRM